MKFLLIILSLYSCYFFFDGISAESQRIAFQNSTVFNEVIYFTFPWYHNRTNYWDVEMQNLFYNFTVKNNQSECDAFVVVTPFVNWNRLCQHNCSLNMNVSYMSWELWGLYVKSVGHSFINYNVILDYGFQQEKKPSYHSSLTWFWITLGACGLAILIIGAFCLCILKSQKDGKEKKKKEKEKREEERERLLP